MWSYLDTLKEDQEALVMSTSRRWVYFIQHDKCIKTATAPTSSLDITVGDRITVKKEKDEYKVLSIHDRENFLTRQYGKQVKRIAANLDRLYVVTAAGALFNTAFINRIACAAHQQSIPITLIINKTDLESDSESGAAISVYKELGMNIIHTAALKGDVESFVADLHDNVDTSVVSLAGVSGVGKSTLLNAIIPGADRVTGAVSEKTGQGKQTTTQAHAYQYQSDTKEILVIDLPGIQYFGITHLDSREILAGMPDLLHFSEHCEYADCGHRAEERCGVKEALEKGKLAQFRYDSYLAMIGEIEKSKDY